MRYVLVFFIIALVLLSGCAKEKKQPPTVKIPPEVEVPPKDVPVEIPSIEQVDFSGLEWFDVHLHCKASILDNEDLKVRVMELAKQGRSNTEVLEVVLPGVLEDIEDAQFACDNTIWKTAKENLPKGGGAILSLAYSTLNSPFQEGFSNPSVMEFTTAMGSAVNNGYALGADTEAHLMAWPSLDCWYDTPFDAWWLDACKKDVDRWVANGAQGFKDYVGGQYVDYFNEKNGFCSGSSCMTDSTVRYPILSDEYRELIRYIVDVKKLPVVSHGVYNKFSGQQCYDELNGGQRDCGQVSLDNLIDFGAWAETHISDEGRRRYISAHMALALPSRHDSPEKLRKILSYGFSMDTAAELEDLQGCWLRETIGMYPRQIVFGTDIRVNNEGTESCSENKYKAYFHALQGEYGAGKKFSSCVTSKPVVGMELGSPTVTGCGDVPENIDRMILVDNVASMY